MGNICANICFQNQEETFQENKVIPDQYQNLVYSPPTNTIATQNVPNAPNTLNTLNQFQNLTLKQISQEFNLKDSFFADCLYFKSSENQLKNVKSFFKSAMLYQTFLIEKLENLLVCLKINDFTLADLFAFHSNSPVFALFWQEIFDDLYAVQNKQKNWQNTPEFMEFIQNSQFEKLFGDMNEILGLYQDSKRQFCEKLKEGKFCFVNSVLVKVLQEFREQTGIENPQFLKKRMKNTFNNYNCQTFAI